MQKTKRQCLVKVERTQHRCPPSQKKSNSVFLLARLSRGRCGTPTSCKGWVDPGGTLADCGSSAGGGDRAGGQQRSLRSFGDLTWGVRKVECGSHLAEISLSLLYILSHSFPLSISLTHSPSLTPFYVFNKFTLSLSLSLYLSNTHKHHTYRARLPNDSKLESYLWIQHRSMKRRARSFHFCGRVRFFLNYLKKGFVAFCESSF